MVRVSNCAPSPLATCPAVLSSDLSTEALAEVEAPHGGTKLEASERKRMLFIGVRCNAWFGMLLIPQGIEPCFCFSRRLENAINRSTGIIGTIRAGADEFLDCAFPDFTQLIAVVCLHPRRFTSCAVDVFRLDGRTG
jgi:hypothetical protein